MIFPIGDDQVKGGYYPFATYALLAINIAIFVLILSLNTTTSQEVYFSYGAIPSEILQGRNLSSVFTSMFLHGGWAHLVGNMLFLWIFADNIEAIIGPFHFILFYLLGGIAAVALQVYFYPMSEIPMIGASGAIAAALGAYIVMFPKSRIRVLILIFFTSIYVPALLFLGFWFVIQFFSGIGASNSTGVAWWAHIGGFVFGIISGIYFKKTYLGPENYRTDSFTVRDNNSLN